MKEKLKELLEKVSDTYPDFVRGATLEAIRYGVVKEFIEYLENNPQADSSEISGALDELHSRVKVRE